MSIEDNPYIKSSKKIYGNTGTTQISSSNLNDIKEQINNAISNKRCLSIFTHLLVDDISEDRGYDTISWNRG